MPVYLFAAALVVLATACSTPRGQPVTYRNETTLTLTLSNDDFLLTTLAPRQSRAITTKESLLPDRIRAYDERNNLIFDKTFTWEYLKAANFIVVIKQGPMPSHQLPGSPDTKG
jgi:hypothetical protein